MSRSWMTASRMLKSAKRHNKSLEEDIAGVCLRPLKKMRVPLTTVAEELSDVQEEPSQYFTNTACQSLKPGLMEGSELKKEGGVG